MNTSKQKLIKAQIERILSTHQGAAAEALREDLNALVLLAATICREYATAV